MGFLRSSTLVVYTIVPNDSVIYRRHYDIVVGL
jgi:hypothetical protein